MQILISFRKIWCIDQSFKFDAQYNDHMLNKRYSWYVISEKGSIRLIWHSRLFMTAIFMSNIRNISGVDLKKQLAKTFLIPMVQNVEYYFERPTFVVSFMLNTTFGLVVGISTYRKNITLKRYYFVVQSSVYDIVESVYELGNKTGCCIDAFLANINFRDNYVKSTIRFI